MHETMNRLIKLQSVDYQLKAINEKMGNLPETVLSFEVRIQEEEEKKIQDGNRISQNKAIVIKSEGKIMDYRTKLERYQEQLYLVTTNREYDALTAEIDYAKKEISDAENIILEAEEESKNLEESIQESETLVRSLTDDLEKAKKDLDKTIQETRDEKERLEAERLEITKKVPRNILNVYERVRKARRGVAVVPIIRDACGGCNNRVIPQKRVDIYKRNKIVTCDICGRFIYSEEGCLTVDK